MCCHGSVMTAQPVCFAGYSASDFAGSAHDLRFNRRGTSVVEEIKLKAIMRTAGVLALIALLTSFGLAAFDDLVAVTVGTKHGNAYHDVLLLKQSIAWHTWGESANLQHAPAILPRNPVESGNWAWAPR
jgi:hypothetical protein